MINQIPVDRFIFSRYKTIRRDGSARSNFKFNRKNDDDKRTGKNVFSNKFGEIDGSGTGFVLRSFSPEEIAEFTRKYAAATRELQKKFDLSETEIKENLRQTENYFRRVLTSFDWSKMPAEIFG